jgi:hypothetical protein
MQLHTYTCEAALHVVDFRARTCSVRYGCVLPAASIRDELPLEWHT